MKQVAIPTSCTPIIFAVVPPILKIPAASGEQEVNKNILIAGGGVSGMTAAIEASKAGYPCTIVEKSAALGGATAQIYKKIPTKAPYTDPVDNGVGL